MPLLNFVLVLSFIVFSTSLMGQGDSLPAGQFPSKYIDQISTKAAKLEESLDHSSTKLLASLQKSEARIQRKLARKDSAKSAQIFQSAQSQYGRLEQKLTKLNSTSSYIPSLDTLATSLSFLKENPALLSSVGNAPDQIKQALTKVKSLQTEFQKAEEIKKFIKERKEYLKQQLQNSGMMKELKKINKDVYYYSAQVNEYKAMLKDHKKAERKALELLRQSSAYEDFLKHNSQLASLFRLPGAGGSASFAPNLVGLQTRSQVNNLIQQQVAAGGPNGQAQFNQNMQDAQSKLNDLKTKINKLGGGSNNMDMPEGFKPNHQKTKRFLDRIELGANMQSQRANGFFPVTSDIGLSAGYKLNDNSIVGLGASYKMGWGQNIRNIKITSQGLGLRSFIEWKLKKSLWIAGGYEMNYRSEIRHIEQLKDSDNWQQSGLLGLSKVVSLKSKVLKKTKLQLLWDLLSYQQHPKPPALLFRIGYSF